MRGFFWIFSFLLSFNIVYGQQYSLYNTNTLFDSFENPSQKVFIADSSRQFAFNFFVPHFGLNGASKGPAEPAFRNLIATGKVRNSNLNVGEEGLSHVFISANSYLVMFKLFQAVERNKELGFSWQLRSDSYLKTPNAALAVFDNFNLFRRQPVYIDLFNIDLNTSTYHQLSITYRQDLDKKTGVGFKLSYLSGLVANIWEVDSSSLEVNTPRNRYNFNLAGTVRSNSPYKEIESKNLFPGIRNPGIAVSLGANRKLRRGIVVAGHLKDLGIIKWTKESYNYSFNNNIEVIPIPTRSSSSQFGKKLDSLIKANYTQGSFYTPTNATAEVLISKDFSIYKPSLLLSKSIFYNSSNISLINNFTYKALNVGISAGYNNIARMQLGVMGMIKRPNFEMYIGADQLMNTYYSTRSLLEADNTIGTGGPGVSIYMGLAIKFGRVLEHDLNSSTIPGID